MSGKISLPLEYALKDLHARASDFRLLGHAVKGLKGRKVISFDMFTPHASYVANSLGQENTLQVQASLISPKPETFFIPGTSFAFIDRVSYERFIEINKRYKDKCIYLGNIKLLGLRERLRKNTKVENIIYFTQPYEHNSEKEILLKLEGICNQLGVRLTVKLHPRQKMNEYEYLQSITFLSDEFNADKYDLALTRSSSIAMDCWAASLPIAFIRETSYTKNLTAEYIPENYTGDLTKVSEVKDLIENYSMFHARFMNARCKLLNDGQVGNVIGNIKRAYINEK